MTSQNNLEINGNLSSHPFAELIAETAAANLSGSLRLSSENQKSIVYFSGGEPVFAVSNARRHRLFETLLRNNQITQSLLSEIQNFTNDFELGEALKERGLFSKTEMDATFTRQIEEILQTALGWTQGEWIFSPLARAKEAVRFDIEYQKLLLEYARNLPPDAIAKRFTSFNESFGANPSANFTSSMLLPQEAFVLSRIEKSFLKIEEVSLLSGLPDVATLQILYTLWLGGFLFRQNWSPAFPEKKISAINAARLSLKKEEKPAVVAETKASALKERVERIPEKAGAAVPLSPIVNTHPAPVETEQGLSVEAYLNRVESAESFYEVLDIPVDAGLSDIKRSYFALAKRFHPDKYHQEKDSGLHARAQNAFTRIAQAYETLKSEDARIAYDLRIRSHLATLKNKTKSAANGNSDKTDQIEIAREYFERGFSLLTDEEYDEALPLLARAAQIAPDNARYHAFYGKVLSSDETQRYKAEAEMQTAIRLEPQNATFRLIMAEFYIQFQLFRRAEGELQRLLEMHPNNKEARSLLDSLRRK